MASRTRHRLLLATTLVATVVMAGCAGAGSSSSRSSGPIGMPGGFRTPRPDAAGEARGRGPTTEVDPAEMPQSTFGMDVDTASYTYARTLLGQGQQPAPESVRPEEFVNAFRQDYPQPPGDGFTVTLDGARLPEQQRTSPPGDVRLLRIGLQTRADDAGARPDAALTFVIDSSGSMGDPGKLDMVRQALHSFIDQLRPTDSVAIVTFNDTAQVLQPLTTGRGRAGLHEAVDELRANGSTNLEGGLVAGYEVAREGFRKGATNRVVLLSDGLANVGDTDAAPILAQVREAAGKQIGLLGVGVGSDYGDALMEQLADRGDGFVIYVSELAAARRAFAERLPATSSVRALDAKVQVTFDPRTVAGYRLVGYDDRALAAQDFRDDRVDGGEVAAGHSVTALYTVRLRAGAGGQVAHTELRWQDPRTHQAVEAGGNVTVADLDVPFARAGARLQVCYAAAYFAERLRHSPSGGQVSGADLARLADAAADRTEDADVRDLARAIRSAAD